MSRRRWTALAGALALISALGLWGGLRTAGEPAPADFGSAVSPAAGTSGTAAGGAVPTAPVTTPPSSSRTAAAPQRSSTVPPVATSIAAPDSGGPVAAPRRLLIPRLGVRAPVDPVGVGPDGQTEIPQDDSRVGWYRFSPEPGAGQGSAVIVGHIDARSQGLGVLAALSRVGEGDQVVVERADGSTLRYAITSRRTVAKSALAASGAFRVDGRPVLTLITCAGPYRRDHGGYQNNLVVQAVPTTW